MNAARTALEVAGQMADAKAETHEIENGDYCTFEVERRDVGAWPVKILPTIIKRNDQKGMRAFFAANATPITSTIKRFAVQGWIAHATMMSMISGGAR